MRSVRAWVWLACFACPGPCFRTRTISELSVGERRLDDSDHPVDLPRRGLAMLFITATPAVGWQSLQHIGKRSANSLSLDGLQPWRLPMGAARSESAPCLAPRMLRSPRMDAGQTVTDSIQKFFDSWTNDAATPEEPQEGRAVTSIRKYFDAWNRRDMDAACACFAANCTYEDTQYAGAFEGQDALKEHLFRVADALPTSFAFVIDEVADGGDTVGIQWHVENEGQPLPFTRGCSVYKADPSTGLLTSGFDVPEPAPFKPGSTSLALLSLASKLIAEPIRAAPLIVWGLYCSIVFFSNGIIPGPDATQLDAATWQEVLGLSLNFWQISPLLGLPFSPDLHPMLEGEFNFLLAWAALFAGFMSDGRPGRASGSMVPTVLGMQLLTNAILLPYLFSRAPETDEEVYYEDLEPREALVSEWKGLGPLLGAVGTGSFFWALFARPEFGDLATRWASFIELLSGDRLGASFVVDLVLFAFFQGWLVDDDLRRRGVEPDDASGLRTLAKFVPFYGLVAYLVARPELPRRSGEEEKIAI